VFWARELATHSPELFEAQIKGQTISEITRRGKYIVFHLTHDFMLIHLKMTGRLYVSPAEDFSGDADRWLRVSFRLENQHELRFADTRKFGRVYLTPSLAEVIGKLGPEPLDDAFTLNDFTSRLAKRHGRIKPILLDQTLLAGVGNIYADEALWVARIDPRREVSTLNQDELSMIYHAVRQVLQQGIDNGGSTIDTYRKPDGSKGENQERFNVYDRMDQPCPECLTPITKIWLAQRGTHYCPVCQT
jgi:formamidopyrimidine-DNA glycosylase